ncbi:MAG: hypothetical protein E7673_06285 [Ruminococcaceae bacterium]|nr:hypothetical protein [Oscillospiraceae bacterium]
MKKINKTRKLLLPILMIAIVLTCVMASAMTVSAEDNSKCSVCDTDYVNGFCSCEGTDSYQPIEKNEDGYYEIGNAGQLYYFAEMIKSEDNLGSNAILTADITVNEKVTENGALVSDTSNLRSWVPMYSGTPENFSWYRGHFEGNGHTISGLYCVSDLNYVGLFALTDATITNLGIVDSYFESTNEHADYVGSIVGNADIVTINNCYSLATVNGTAEYNGGLFGRSSASSVIDNCYFGGKIIGKDSSQALIGIAHGHNKIGKLYYATECGKTSEIGEALSEEKMLSGYLAYKLNAGKRGAEWYQNVGEGYPAFSGKTVYASEPCPSNFSNNESDLESKEHSFIAIQGNDVSVHWISACEFCGELEQTFDHNFGEDDHCVDCNFIHEFKTVDKYGNVEYYTRVNGFDSLEAGTVIYMLKDYNCGESVSIYSQNVIFDLNGNTLSDGLYIGASGEGTVIVKDSSSEKTGTINHYVNVFSNVAITDCKLGEYAYIYVGDGYKAVLRDITVETQNISTFSNTEDEIKIISAKFNNGFDITDLDYGYGIDAFLTETGYITDSEGNVIEITEGQQLIEGSFSINTYVASVTIGEETKKYNDFNKTFIDASEAEHAKITLLTDIYEYEGRVENSINESSNITLDLAGKSISSHTFISYGKLIIEDSSEEQTGTINTVPFITTLCVYGGETVINSGRLNCTVFIEEGNLTVNGGVICDEQIAVRKGNVVFNNVNFEEGAQIYLDFVDESEAAVKIYGGSFASLSLSNGTLADVIPENYLPKLDSGAYVTDFSKSHIVEPFKVAEHTHVFEFKGDNVGHHKECECGLVDEATVGNHTGGTATCDDRKLCEVCNLPYGEPLGHDWSEYVSLGNGTHKSICKRDDNHFDIKDCSTDEPLGVCGSKNVCDVCKAEYGDALEHDFSGDYIHEGTTHYKSCQRTGCDVTDTPENCTPGTPATCTEPQICTVCFGTLEDAKGHTEKTGATCEAPAVCSTCDESYGEPLGHDYKNGVCTRCEDTLAMKVVVNSYGAIYCDSLQEAVAASMYGADTIEITLLDNVTVSDDETIYVMSGKITLDLAGYGITDLAISLMGADLTIIDSSEEKTGFIIMRNEAPLVVMTGSLTVNGGSFDSGIYALSTGSSSATINGGFFEGEFLGSVKINGGIFNDISIMLNEDTEFNPIIKGGTFKNVTVLGTQNAALSAVFSSAPCVSYLDADGNHVDIDFTAITYEGEFKLIHDDGHVNKTSYVSDAYNHWFECENDIAAFIEPHTFGEGTECTLCGESAPIIVEASGKHFGFNDFADALDCALSKESAKIILYSDVMYMGDMSMEIPSLNVIGADLTIDLNGMQLLVYGLVGVIDAKLTVTDSSEEKSGSLDSISGDIHVINGMLVLKDVVFDELRIYLDISSYLLLDGATFENNVHFHIADNSEIAVRKASFETGISIESEYGYDLAYYFDAKCLTLLDENNEELVLPLDVFNYEGAFTLSHDDTHFTGEITVSDNGVHWSVCEYCNLRSDKTACSGGEATCDTGAICDICNDEYTDPKGHKYNSKGVCTVCNENAIFTVSDGSEKWYFGTSYDAFKKADSLENATVTVDSNYIVRDEEINLNSGAVITLDLNGYSLAIDEVNLYGSTLIITDTSKRNTGTLYFDSTIDIYEGKLVFEAGNIRTLNIDLDPENGNVELVINGGTFDDLDIDTDSDYYNIYLTISGGMFGYINFDIDDDTELCVNGGEFYSITSEGSYLEYIDEIIILADCIAAFGENGARVYPDLDGYDFYDYFKLSHVTVIPDEGEYDANNEYHWYACDCGFIISKESHSGGTATCEARAICDICEYEYGYYAPHKYDENLVCEICDEEANGIIKVEGNGYVVYYNDLYDVFDDIRQLNKAVITLLADCDATEDYLYLEYVGEIVIDLNGFELTVSNIGMYDTDLTITDGSKNQAGKLIIDNEIYVYGCKLTVCGGNIENFKVMFDSDYTGGELIIEGGNIDLLETGGNGISINDDYAKIRIKGGTIEAFVLAYPEGVDVEITGGEFTESISIIAGSKRFSTLESLLPGACYAYYTENGEKAEGIMKSNLVYSYVKVLHTESYSLSHDEYTHYEECLCGETRNVTEHTYDNECDAECNVCKAMRTTGEHVYDSVCDAECNVCRATRANVGHVYDSVCDAECNVCGVTRQKNAHSFGATEIITEPTRKTDGEGRVTCSHCGTVETVVIPAKGGMSPAAVVAITAGGTVATLSGAFSLIWFVIKKKKWADLVAAFK